MSRLMIRLLAALAASGLACGVDGADSLNAALVPIRATHHLPALAAAVVNSDGLVASGAVGVRQVGTDRQVTLQDRFHVGSCAKAMTATLIAMHVEERAILWDTTIEQAFPELLDHINASHAKATLRHLLTHMAGIPPATAGNSDEGRLIRALTGSPAEQRAAMVEKLLAAKPHADPGQEHVYSNAGYGVAVAMLERATGKAWETLMRERLFGPLGMTSAGLGWPANAEHPEEPLGHGDSKQGLTPHGMDHPYTLSPGIAPAGDVHCSIEDFARFAQMHLRGLRGQSTLLKPETVQKLHEPEKNNYACGWVRRRVAGQDAHWHNGSAGTFFAWMTIWPEHDLAIVVATNAGTGQPACEAATVELFAGLIAKKSLPRPDSDQRKESQGK